MAKKAKSDQQPRYEDLVAQIEELVDNIESGELGLEESIRGYEEGTKLIKHARGILDQAQQRVEAINLDELEESSD